MSRQEVGEHRADGLRAREGLWLSSGPSVESGKVEGLKANANLVSFASRRRPALFLLFLCWHGLTTHKNRATTYKSGRQGAGNTEATLTTEDRLRINHG